MKIHPDCIRPRLRTGKPNIGSLFLDSGAFSIFHVGKLRHNLEWYDTKAFRKYMDAYAAFVRRYEYAIDYYATVDVITDSVRSMKSLKYLEEEHGLNPVPVIHNRADPKLLDYYLERGDRFIGFGGMGSMKSHEYKRWLDRMFQHICPKSNDYKPIVKVHGFAITSWSMLTRFPWYSVDSTTYNKMAGYGWLLIPHFHGGKWDFSRRYHQIGVCGEASPKSMKKYGKYYSNGQFRVSKSHRPVFVSPTMQDGKKHIGPQDRPNREARKIVERWCDFIGIPLGDADTPGVSNTFGLRSHSNILYFDMLRQAIPKYPARFKPSRGPTLLDLIQDKGDRVHPKRKEREVKIYFSGVGAKDHRAEDLLEDSCVMLTAYDFSLRNWEPDDRFKRHLKERKRCRR
jgi:hypothetical protein